MPFSGMLRRAALVRTNVSEEHIVSIIRVTIISELETTLTITSNRSTLLVIVNVPNSTILVILIMEAIRSSETFVLTRAARLNIPEDCILHSHLREKL
jgi:hypothetical protein